MQTREFRLVLTPAEDVDPELPLLLDDPLGPDSLSDVLRTGLQMQGLKGTRFSINEVEHVSELAAGEEAERTPPEPLKGQRIGPDGRKRTLGPIDAVHEIGEYLIIEFRWDASNSSQALWHHHGKTYFEPYIAGKSTCVIHESLDSALVGAIGYKREGPNGQAAWYFERMTTNVSAD